MQENDKSVLVYSTFPTPEVAEDVGRALVEARLAACVNILPPMRSIYKWKGKTESADEQLLLIKSACERFPALMARVRALHPYELPEIVAVPIADGLPDYLAWLHHPE